MNAKQFPILLLLFSLLGCSSDNDETHRFRNQKGEYISRRHNDPVFTLAPPHKLPPQSYPWDKIRIGSHSQITKEYFRCKGSSLNPAKVIQQKEGPIHWHDCGGVETHSLPLKDGKEFIYPILLDLLNFIQEKTGKKVVITCGHRCPQHNTYADDSTENQYSKHMIGAEVAFYVQGMEEQPEAVIKLIQSYYNDNPRYSSLKDYKEYSQFKRYEKSDTNVTTQPWHNKEIFLKLFKKTEGRNFDNRHPYPYISVQVRLDRDSNEKVNYSWDKATKNYLRW